MSRKAFWKALECYSNVLHLAPVDMYMALRFHRRNKTDGILDFIKTNKDMVDAKLMVAIESKKLYQFDKWYDGIKTSWGWEDFFDHVIDKGFVAEEEFDLTGWDLQDGVEYLSNWKDRIYKKVDNAMYFRLPHETEWTACVRSMMRFKEL